MPAKTNTVINDRSYFRTSATVGKKPDGTPIRKQFYGATKKEAEQKRDDYINHLERGLSVGFDKLSFGAAFCQWFDTVHKPALALSSLNRYEYDRDRILQSDLPAMKLNDVKAIHVQAFYDGLIQSGASVNKALTCNKLLSKFFAYATRTDLIAKNIMLAVDPPKDRSIREEKAIPSRADMQKLISYAQENDSAFIFVFLAFTGLREGEALALTHNDIDLTEGVIKVNKSLNHLMIDGKYTPIISTTKTTGSTRQVPLLDDLLPMLKAHILSEKEKHLRIGCPFSSENALFTSEACTYLYAKNLRVRFSRLLERLDISSVVVHSLRHYFCTLLAENGVNLKTAADLLGHSSINTTAKIYTHVQQDEKKRGIATLSDIFTAG